MSFVNIKIIFLFTILIYSINCKQIIHSARNYRALQMDSLTLAESPSYYLLEPNGPGTYAFGYEVDDPSSGNVQFRDEEKLANGTIRGSYGYMRPDGLISITRYTADTNGYRSETQTFKRGEKPNQDFMSIPHPLDHDVVTNKQEDISLMNMSSEDEMKKMLKNNEKTNGAMMIEDKQPDITIMRKNNSNGKRYGVQLINNFVPANFPIITFNQPEKDLKTKPSSSNGDNNDIGHDFVDFTNDKFHNPLTDETKMLKQMMMIKDNDISMMMTPLMADTREALWYKELIRNRRREFLKRYGYQAKF